MEEIKGGSSWPVGLNQPHPRVRLYYVLAFGSFFQRMGKETLSLTCRLVTI